jgi:hypothetical protein
MNAPSSSSSSSSPSHPSLAVHDLQDHDGEEQEDDDTEEYSLTESQEDQVLETQMRRLATSPFIPQTNPVLCRREKGEPFRPIVCSTIASDRILRLDPDNTTKFTGHKTSSFRPLSSTMIHHPPKTKRTCLLRRILAWLVVLLSVAALVTFLVILFSPNLWPIHRPLIRTHPITHTHKETFLFQYNNDFRYLVYMDVAHQTYVIHCFVNGKRTWSLFNDTYWESPQMYFPYNAIVKMPTIDWSDLSLAIDPSLIDMIDPPFPAFSTFAAWPYSVASSPGASQTPIRHLSRSHIRQLTRLTPSATKGILELADGQLSLDAMMQKYQETYFDPSIQSFAILPLVDQIEQNMPLVVPSEWANNDTLLTTYVWPTDNSSWCPSNDMICGLPSCECIRERVDRLTGFIEFNGCSTCLTLTDYGCYCWAQLWQYRQILLSQSCYESTDDFVRGLITYPCRTKRKCNGLISTPLNDCVNEIQMCENAIVKQKGFTCYI